MNHSKLSKSCPVSCCKKCNSCSPVRGAEVEQCGLVVGVAALAIVVLAVVLAVLA